MASLRGNTTLFDGDLAQDIASDWAYVGSGTDLTLFIDDGGAPASWAIEVAVGNGEPGLNGIDPLDPDAVPWAVLKSRTGSGALVASSGAPLAMSLSPFAAQYIRVRPDAAITAGSARINVVAHNSRSLRGHQVLWDDEDVSLGDTSAVGFVGDETNALLFLNVDNAGHDFIVEVAAGTGASGLNEIPEESAWAALYLDGNAVAFGTTSTSGQAAIDLSPFGGSFVRLKASQNSTGVTATLAVSD